MSICVAVRGAQFLCDGGSLEGVFMYIHLKQLLQSQLGTVLSRERRNEDSIHLYAVGEYWAAFDKSAYLLEGVLLQDRPPMTLCPKGQPFPLLMYHIPKGEMISLRSAGEITAERRDYLSLRLHPIIPSDYHKWRKQKTLSNVQ